MSLKLHTCKINNIYAIFLNAIGHTHKLLMLESKSQTLTNLVK